MHDITIIERRNRSKSMPKYARELIKTGLFIQEYLGGTSIILRLKGTDYIIIFPRTIEVKKEDVFWQKNEGSQKKLYIRRDHLKLNFQKDHHPKQIPVSLLDIFDTVSGDIVEDLAFHLDLLPE